MSVASSTASSPPREIAPGIWWLPECLRIPLGGVETHLHVAPYLVLGSEKTLLWDTASPSHWSTVARVVDELLDGRPLDYIVPSHPEVAHCGNTHRFLAHHPEARLAGDLRDYRLYFPEYAGRMETHPCGSILDLGSHQFEFVEATLKDLPSSQWAYERTQQVLFVADGFAYSHRPPLEGDDRPTHAPGECTLFASELGAAPGPEQVVWITKAALYWTSFVRLDLFVDSFKTLLATHPVKLVAPAHGAVIDSIDSILWTIWDALSLSYDPDRGVGRAGQDFRKAEAAV